MSNKLRARRVLIVLGAAHLHHSAPFSLENAQELITPRNPRSLGPNSDLFVYEEQLIPPVFAAFGSEHRVGADHIEVARQRHQQRLGELLDGEHVYEERISPEPLERQRIEDLLGGDYGGAEQNDLRVLLAEVVRVGEERNAEGLRRFGVVGSGMGEDGVALIDQSFGEELAEVSEANDGDFEHVGGLVLRRELGFVVEDLRGV